MLQPPTLPEMTFFTSIFHRFCQLFRNSYFQKPLRMATRFSRDFVANFARVFASSVVVFICLSYCLQKEINWHKHVCDNICDMLKLMIFTNLTFCFFLVHFCYLFFKLTDVGFIFSQWFFCKVSPALSSELNII